MIDRPLVAKGRKIDAHGIGEPHATDLVGQHSAGRGAVLDVPAQQDEFLAYAEADP